MPRNDGVICGAKTRGDGHPCLHAPGCAVELAERILKDMDPQEPLNLWRMIVSAWRMRHEH